MFWLSYECFSVLCDAFYAKKCHFQPKQLCAILFSTSTITIEDLIATVNRRYYPYPKCHTTSFRCFFENPPTYPQNVEHGNTKWQPPQWWKLWMNTLKKATFTLVFIYIQYITSWTSMVTTDMMQYKYILNWHKISEG